MSDDRDRHLLLGRLRSVTIERGWRVEAWCLMTTHLHVVVSTPDADLGIGLGRLLGWYARRHNLRHGGEGHLWRRPFYSERIVTPEHLVRAGVYAAVNPIAAGVCGDPGGFQWSGYRVTAGLVESDGLTDPSLLLRALGDDPVRARRSYRELVADAVERVRAAKQHRADPRVVVRKAVERAVTSGVVRR